jgi:hypothetical protein
MLTHEALEGEDARTTILPGTGGLAGAAQRPGSCADGVGYGAVGDDAAVADDHGSSQVSVYGGQVHKVGEAYLRAQRDLGQRPTFCGTT